MVCAVCADDGSAIGPDASVGGGGGAAGSGTGALADGVTGWPEGMTAKRVPHPWHFTAPPVAGIFVSSILYAAPHCVHVTRIATVAPRKGAP